VDEKQAKGFGKYLKKQREAKGLSARELGRRANVDDSTIVRFEQGAYANPAPDKLVRLAEALDLSVADIFAHAHYALPSELPTLPAYLRLKYGDLPATAMKDLERYVSQLADKYGLDADGPQRGEDERP
jgi:transcriptional regulator with XRE-family HTH domain